MINGKTFEYKGKSLIEKAIFEPPHKHERVFQNEGCFLFFKEAGIQLISAHDNRKTPGNEAVLLNCGTYFLDILKTVDNKPIEVIAIHLFPDLLKKLYANELPELIKKRTYNKQSQVIQSDHVIAKFIESIEFYFDNPTLVNEDLLELKIKELILLLLQTNNVGSILELVTGLYSTKTINLRSIIDLHVLSNLSTEELAKLCGLSLSSFKREFKKEFDDTPKNYINHKRIERAKELLRVSDLHVNEIAYDLGFNDPLYFTRLFKNKTGVSPSAYKSTLNN